MNDDKFNYDGRDSTQAAFTKGKKDIEVDVANIRRNNLKNCATVTRKTHCLMKAINDIG